MSAEVVVLGSLHLDIVVQAPRLPHLGETLPGTGWALHCGGKGGNQAVAAARHGARTAMVGAVGYDDFGGRLLANLRVAGVDTTHVAVRDEAGSGMSVAIVEGGGDYGAAIVSGVNLALGPEAVRAAASAFAGAGWLVLQNEVPEAANLAAAAAARAAGAGVLLNAAPARPLGPALAAALDVLVVNAIEAEGLCGLAVAGLEDARVAARRLLATAPVAMVTAGAAGLAAAGRKGWDFALPGHAVRPVSAHGAGDAFIGALAAQLAAGATLEQAARYANAAAALLVATPPDRRDALAPADVCRLLEAAL